MAAAWVEGSEIEVMEEPATQKSWGRPLLTQSKFVRTWLLISEDGDMGPSALAGTLRQQSSTPWPSWVSPNTPPTISTTSPIILPWPGQPR